MNRFPILLIAALVLSACGQREVFTPTTVKVPVQVKCDVDIPQEPDWHAGHTSPDAPLMDKLKAVLADRELNKGYDSQLIAAITACKG